MDFFTFSPPSTVDEHLSYHSTPVEEFCQHILYLIDYVYLIVSKATLNMSTWC